ncbi:MAG: glycosyltransferase family 9 protein [Bryobacteraceae bacterium]|nr:glycosyltransferase family 9 protein [Bryobacteraceae bacterium]
MNILVVRLGAMGDILHTLPAVELLHRTRPEAKIYWIAESRWHPLLEGHPALAGLLPFDRHSWRGLRESRQALRAERFAWALDFQGLIKSSLVAWQSGAARRTGAARTREAPARWFYTERVTTASPHIVDQHAELVGRPEDLRPVTLPAGVPEGRLPDGPFVLASPFAGWVSKQWPLEHYAALARMLPLPLVLNVAPSQAEAVAGFAHVHVSSIAGLIDATRRARAVLGVDSGPLHLAAALAKPGVALFGGTDPARNGPYGASLRVLRHPSAVTSYERGEAIDPRMRDLSPEQVYAAIAPHVVP